MKNNTGKWKLPKTTIAITAAGSIMLAAGQTGSADAYPHLPYIKWDPPAAYADSDRMFQGIPSIETAPAERLWATWYGGGYGEGHDNYVMLATSDDGGLSWSDVLMVVDPPFRASEPALWLDPSGKLWFLFNLYPRGLRGHGSQLWAMNTTNPDSATPEWSSPRLISMDLNNFNKPIVTDEESWLWPSGSWNLDAFSRPLLSDDNGDTFKLGGVIPMKREDRNFDEYQVVELNDGRLWLLTRTSYGIGESFSDDGGITWTEVVPSAITHTPSRFFITRLQSGNLLLVKNGPVDQDVGRTQLTTFLSQDDGQTWSGGLLLDARSSVSYPDGTQAEDGTIYITYDHQRVRDKEILLAVFTEEDVLAGETISDQANLRLLINKARGFNPRYETADLISGPAAVLRGDNAVEKQIATGERIFQNRDYTWNELPEGLGGRNFPSMNIEGGKATVLKPGVVLVATPLPSRNTASQESLLLEQGFVRTNIPEFSLFEHSRRRETLCVIFQKEVDAGDTIELGMWGVMIY